MDFFNDARTSKVQIILFGLEDVLICEIEEALPGPSMSYMS